METMANYQEAPPEEFQEILGIGEVGFESGDIHRLEMLHLNSTPPGHSQFTAVASTNTTPADVRVRPLERCTSCGSIKRRSPSSLSSLQEPSAKRAALGHPATTNATAGSDGNQNVCLGSGKLPLDNAACPIPMPPTSFNTRQTVLNRSLSDITSYMGTQETGEPNAHVQALNSQPAENSKINSMSASPSPAAASLPPLAPILHRSLSDPIPSSDYQPVAESTPSRPPAARTCVPSPSSDQESSNSKLQRLRRIKEKMKQMSEWMEKVTSEEDNDEDTCSENDDTSDKNPKEMCVDEPVTRPNQEAVWVEESGENLIVHFKCPCGRGYEIFLSGKKCYYRLL